MQEHRDRGPGRVTVVVPVYKTGPDPVVAAVSALLPRGGAPVRVLDMWGVHGGPGQPSTVLAAQLAEPAVTVVSRRVKDVVPSLSRQLWLAAEVADVVDAARQEGTELLVVAPGYDQQSWVYAGLVAHIADQLVLCASWDGPAPTADLGLTLLADATSAAALVLGDEELQLPGLEQAVRGVFASGDPATARASALSWFFLEEACLVGVGDHTLGRDTLAARRRVLSARATWLLQRPPADAGERALLLLEDLVSFLDLAPPGPGPFAGREVEQLLDRLPEWVALDDDVRDRLHPVALQLTASQHPAAHRAVLLLR